MIVKTIIYLLRENLKGFSVIPSRYETCTNMENSWQIQKRNETWLFNKVLYNQRNKDETIVSVIKRLFGEHITSKLIRMQNRELTFRCIAYNVHRMLKFGYY